MTQPLIVGITVPRAERLKKMTTTPTIALRFKIHTERGEPREEMMATMVNPFYKEPERPDAKRIGRAIKRSTKALGEMMTQVGTAAAQPALAELGEHTVAESKRLDRKKTTGRYVATKSALKSS